MSYCAGTMSTTAPHPRKFADLSPFFSGGIRDLPTFLRSFFNTILSFVFTAGGTVSPSSMPNAGIDRSYRALLAVPNVRRLLLGMQISRIAQSMVGITLVLFALQAYKSITLSGLTIFFSIFPGLLVSPIAGALLDRHGRTRLVVIDYLMALLSLTSIGV